MNLLRNIILTLLLVFSTELIKAQEPSNNMSENSLLVAYLNLKNALADDNFAIAKISASAMADAADTMPVKDLSADQQKLWQINVKRIKDDSRQISESSAIAVQRQHFAGLSKNMYAVFRDLKINKQVLYEQYCPMKKATWLSESSAIRNPYFGKQMLSCGTNEATIGTKAKAGIGK
jgi:hypothetical protein